MAITVTREVKEVTINVTREGKTITIQPVISKSGGEYNLDHDVDGGSL